MLNEKKKEKKSKLSPLIIPNEQTPTQTTATTALPIDELEQNKKQARRETTLKAKDILSPLICKRKEITDEEILNILPILNEDAVSNNMWDAERVKKYLLRHDSNKKQENA